MIKYFAWSGFDIEKREVIRETAEYVYLPSKYDKNGKREAKMAENRGYFDTFSEARLFLLEIEEGKIAALTKELAGRHENIRKIEEMTE